MPTAKLQAWNVLDLDTPAPVFSPDDQLTGRVNGMRSAHAAPCAFCDSVCFTADE